MALCTLVVLICTCIAIEKSTLDSCRSNRDDAEVAKNAVADAYSTLCATAGQTQCDELQDTVNSSYDFYNDLITPLEGACPQVMIVSKPFVHLQLGSQWL